jgi:pimeloyl-ACP methyl ester carboxylesterase
MTALVGAMLLDHVFQIRFSSWKGLGERPCRIMSLVNKYLPVTLLLIFVLGGCSEKTHDPGGYVDVGGYRLYYETYGSGSPTVIFENGSGSELTDWQYVAPEIAKTNRVILYDRAGLGRSDFGTCPRDAYQRVAEFNTLLTALNVNQPFVLVSHSLGCILSRYYRHLYPGNVLGMIQVDPGHESLLTRAGTAFAAAVHADIIAFSKNLTPGQSAEAFGTFDTWTEVEAAGLKSVGNIPLTVIVSTQTQRLVPEEALNEIGNNALRELQKELVGQSPQGKLVTAEGSGHMVQLEQPQLVIDAVKAVLAKVVH